MSLLSTKQLQALTEGGVLSSLKGFPSLFINGASCADCQRLGVDRGFTVAVNGKPFSPRGANAGSVRTRKLGTYPSAEEAVALVREIAFVIRESDTLHGFNTLLASCDDGEADDCVVHTELTKDQTSCLIDQLYREVYFSRELLRVSKGEWSDVIYRRPEASAS